MQKRNASNRKSVGILGGGFIGQVLKRYYAEAAIYDIRPGAWDSIEDVLSREYIFVAINIPDNARHSESKKILEDYLRRIPDGRTVILKSTIVPGTTAFLQERAPNLAICYNPEFLTEQTAWEDFTEPQFQILGLTPQSLPKADALLQLLPDAPVRRVMTPHEAEVIKHATNSYYAMKVIFFNQIYDACQRVGADYEVIREILIQNPWIGDSHSIVWHKGYRGFGGKCLPKDIAAFADVTDSPLFHAVIAENDKLRNASFEIAQNHTISPATQRPN